VTKIMARSVALIGTDWSGMGRAAGAHKQTGREPTNQLPARFGVVGDRF